MEPIPGGLNLGLITREIFILIFYSPSKKGGGSQSTVFFLSLLPQNLRLGEPILIMLFLFEALIPVWGHSRLTCSS